MDDFDDIDCENFTFYYKNRKKFTSHRSGGIAVGCKNYLQNFLHPIDTECQFIYWFKIDRNFLGLQQDAIFGVVYIPPENTRYAIDDAISEIEIEFMNFQKDSSYVCLFGDFNSRTGKLNDFYETNDFDDRFISELFDYNEFSDISILDDLGISRLRNTPDNIVNSYGRKLINFCKNNNMFILNGRMFADCIGKPTSKNQSVIDYAICSGIFFHKIQYFEVSNFSKLYSDIHSPLILEFDCKRVHYTNVDTCTENISELIGRWNFDKIKDFKDNIDSNQVNNLLSSILLNSENIVNIEQTNVDDFVYDVTNILLESARKTFGVYSVSSHVKEKRMSKDWFDKNCKKARQDYRKSLRLYKHYGSNIFKERLKHSERVYKVTMDNSIRNFNEKLKQQMKSIRNRNPREFWKILNQKKNKVNSDLDIQTLFDFFKEINKNTNDVNTIPENIFNTEESNVFLNSSITREEIFKAIQNVKNNKAAGDDQVINEYICSSADIMIDVYVNLFNLIFDTGLVPEVWLIGNVIPVFKNKGNKSDPKNYRPITLSSNLGKIFTSVLNKRLCDYLDQLLILHENQAGFRFMIIYFPFTRYSNYLN